MNTIYFQPKDINPKYCEIGIILETDPKYIWYLDDPCKIIDKENVFYNKKTRLYIVK